MEKGRLFVVGSVLKTRTLVFLVFIFIRFFVNHVSAVWIANSIFRFNSGMDLAVTKSWVSSAYFTGIFEEIWKVVGKANEKPGIQYGSFGNPFEVVSFFFK